MHTSPLKRWLVGIILFATLLFAAFLWLKPLLRIGGGYAAKHACSCHFLQGRELEEISTHDLNFSVLGWYDLARKGTVVQADFFGLVRREAHYLEGRGCVLINAPTEDFPPADAVFRPAREPSELDYDPFDRDALEDALDFGMQPVPGGRARGIVVLKNGVMIGEAYAPGYDATTPLLGWSMTKSLTGMAVGAWLARSLPDDTAPAPPPERLTGLFPEAWTDKRAEISLADLLHMNSGLAWNEGYGSITDATVMLHERPDFADFAMRSQLIEEPGTTWNYSSGTTNLLMEYLRRETGSNEALHTYLDELFGSVAPSLLIEPDQSGRPVGSSYGWATAHDWARLGQLMLQDGIWEGDTLLPPGWIDYMREPAAGSNGEYGAQLWLPGPDTPSLPADAYMMRGFQDQRVIVIPSRQLVIARLGHGDDKVTDFDGLIRRILEADE
ncbi:serine hydrolase [Lewinella sp. JB7]|uniref:serine hydrolase domain-containing protein n=1 Tax=Lewinella sp. JB7 TaxID=2962887 RepID=UPI0020C9EE47|nr:serine hydrolase [Lewinella sp. JB7]MCP9236648.1 beta-lactamase family protein [Lewinella sp. JB7]